VIEFGDPLHVAQDALMGDDGTAVLVVDMLNPYEHEDADILSGNVENVVEPIAELVRQAGEDGVDVIYVNDNYGDWRYSRDQLVKRALDGARRDLIEPIVPPEDASFVIKPRHTAFFETPLEYLLRQKGAGHVVLTGQVTEQCILYSALDAYVRHLAVTVPRDCVAHIHESLAEAALQMMERNMRANVVAGAPRL
jgi:nicotinamidase-related amidase